MAIISRTWWAYSCWVLSNSLHLHGLQSPDFPVLHYLSEFAQTMSFESVMPSSHLILFHSLLLLPSIFPSIRVLSNELVLCIGSQSIGASASVLPMNIQGWFALGLTSLISLLSKEHSRVSSSTTVQNHQFFISQPQVDIRCKKLFDHQTFINQNLPPSGRKWVEISVGL